MSLLRKFLSRSRRRKQIRDATHIGIGSGNVDEGRGWLATEHDDLDVTDRASFVRYWTPGTRRGFVAEHVWEHLTPEDAAAAVRNCFTFLASGGRLRIAVPDGNFPDPNYIEHVRPGGTGAGADDHKVLWTAATLSKLLGDAGFEVRLLEWWDEAGAFHAEPWSSQDGHIRRSKAFDPRNVDGALRYTSLIVDGIRP